MVVILVQRFDQNKNATSITYKSYGETSVDKYPTFSICLEGTRMRWYNPMNIFKAFSLSPFQYEEMLKGNDAYQYQYIYASKLFRKTLTNGISNVANESSFDYNSFNLHVSDILVQVSFESETSKYEMSYGNEPKMGPVKEPPFVITYQTPDMICFTRSQKNYFSEHRMRDSLLLKNITNMAPYINSQMKVFIHYPGQLMRSLDRPRYATLFSEYRVDKSLEFRLSQGTVLRKRPDSNEGCNMEIENYDRYLQAAISSDVGCIPSYWLEQLKNLQNLQVCTSPKQLAVIYEKTTNLKDTLEDPNYHKPCQEMFNSVAWNFINKKGNTGRRKERAIDFVYIDKYYEEIEYSKDFGSESFISNLGGFIGIFLGYSMMQLPELLGIFHEY